MTSGKIKTSSIVMLQTTCPLHDAASRNDTVEIASLLTATSNITKNLSALKKNYGNWNLKKILLDVVRNTTGQTPLHVAVENNCYEAVVILTREGCDINAQDNKGNTALHIAEQKNFTQIIQRFFNLPNLPNLMDLQNKDGDTVFHLAVVKWSTGRRNKHDVAIHMNHNSVRIFNNDGYSPFHLAIKLNKKLVVLEMLEKDPQLGQSLSGNGEPPLWVALKHGHLDMMQVLLNEGCNINQKNTKIDAPPIWLAIYRQNKQAMNLLLQSSEFDMTTLDEASLDGISPILLAMIKGDEEQVDQVVNISTDNDKWSTLALKVKYALATDKDFKTITSNANILHRTDSEDNTLLHMAVMSDNIEMVKGIVSAGSDNIMDVIKLADARQCINVLAYLSNKFGVKICMKNILYSVIKEFPRFSDDFQDLFHSLTNVKANKPWFVIEPNEKGHILYMNLKKYIISRVNIDWSNIKKVKGSGIPTFALLSQIKRIQDHDDQNTVMVRDFLSILIHIETYLRNEDELFKHLNVVLLPVGSTVEGTKVGRLNELDVMFFCTELHGSLLVEDEQTICISEDKYNDLPMIIRDLFDLKTRKLDMANFFAMFMQSIKKAMQDLVAKDMVPKNIELFLAVSKCTEVDCKASSGEEWSQCHHIEPPCVCYTAVGAGLNFVWRGGDDNKDMVFTIDIVPNFYVDFNGNSNFNLRKKLIRYLIDSKPVGWSSFLKKYIRDDRIYLGQFDLEQRKFASVGIKMINTRGDFTIRPGMNMHATNMLENKIVHETYCFLKVLKKMTGSKVKSFDLKKAISDQLKSSRMEKPNDVFSFAKLILNSPDLKGKFDGLCQPLTEYYLRVDFNDFPAKNSSLLALQLISKNALLVEHMRAGNLENFRQLLRSMKTGSAKDMIIDGMSLLHYAVIISNHVFILELLLAGCDVNFQDIEGDTALQFFLSASKVSDRFNTLQEEDILSIVQLLSSYQKDDVNLGLQNKSGKTVFHLLARTNLGSKVDSLLLSKASKHLLDITDQNGRTALMHACKEQDRNDFASEIVAKGASVVMKDNDGNTALHFASLENNCFLIKLMLSQEASIDEQNDKGMTPMMLACTGKDGHKSANLLLNRGANVNAMSTEGCTALYYAAVVSGHLDTVRILVKEGGADMDMAGALGTPLWNAIEYLDILEFLLKSGADVNKCMPMGTTTLFHASKKGLVPAVQILLYHGAEVDKGDIEKGLTPLFIASEYDHMEIAKLLLENDACVDLADKKNGSTPLYIASQNGHLGITQLLLKHNASVDKGNTTDGTTPLHIASQNGYVEVVRLLLGKRANPNLATADGQTALFAASVNGHLGVVELLLQSGANVNKADRKNVTPLILASSKGHADVVSLLLNKNADVSVIADEEYTALYLACLEGHLQVVKILVENGGAEIDNNCFGTARKEICDYLLTSLG